ncbi:transposase [Streptomyces collinus]|uniref:transposase n=1 Tax=Streptomyces collinus TaxID=42684 RepID=UPI0036A48FFC
MLTRLQSLADSQSAIRWDLSVDSTVCRAHQHAAGARKQGHLQKERPGGVFAELSDHGLGRSRGGFTTKLHLAIEQGQKPMSIVITTGQRGGSPQFEPVLEKVRVPRIGPGRPRVRPDRVRADKAYASRGNRAHLRRRGISCTVPGKGDQARNRQKLGSPGGRPPYFDPVDHRERHAVECGINASRGIGPSPRDMTSSRSATRQPFSSQPSTNGCDQPLQDSYGPPRKYILPCARGGHRARARHRSGQQVPSVPPAPAASRDRQAPPRDCPTFSSTLAVERTSTSSAARRHALAIAPRRRQTARRHAPRCRPTRCDRRNGSAATEAA